MIKQNFLDIIKKIFKCKLVLIINEHKIKSRWLNRWAQIFGKKG